MTFETNNLGIITSPGKFEGELACVPELWDLALEGKHDRGDHFGDFIFYIDQELQELIKTPLPNFTQVTLSSDNQGFVHARWQEEAKPYFAFMSDEYGVSLISLGEFLDWDSANEKAEVLEEYLSVLWVMGKDGLDGFLSSLSPLIGPVKITVLGGVAEVQECPEFITIEINDMDHR